MDDKDRAEAIEAATTAWRPRSAHELPIHPAWYDLDPAGREEAFEITRTLRTMEAALDRQGWSSTVHAIVRRLRAEQDQ